MKRKWIIPIATTVIGVLALSPAMGGSAAKAGELKNVEAWLDLQPGSAHSLHVQGTVEAPTPCYAAIASRQGSDGAELQIAVTLQARSRGMCAQVLSDIPFRFQTEGIGAQIKSLEVLSNTDRKKVSVKEVH